MKCKNCKKILSQHSLGQLQLCLREFEEKMHNEMRALQDKAERQRLESQLGE